MTETKNLHIVLEGVSQVLGSRFKTDIMNKDLSKGVFLQRLMSICNVKEASPCKFDYLLSDNSMIIDPAYQVCTSALEPIIAKWSSSPALHDLKQMIDDSLFIKACDIDTAIGIIQKLFAGEKIPFYYCDSQSIKSKHLIFHYYCVCFFYVLCRICGENKRTSYKEAGRWARFSAIQLKCPKLKELYLSGGNIAGYCTENDILYNVCLHALSDYHYPLGDSTIRVFVILNRHAQGYRVAKCYLDDKNDGIAQVIRDEGLNHEIKKQLNKAVKNKANGHMMKLIHNASIQNSCENKKVSIRVVRETADALFLKITMAVNSDSRSQTIKNISG